MLLIYIVKSGDSLFELSEKFKVGTEEISRVNGLGLYPYLVIGQSLVIPAANKNESPRRKQRGIPWGYGLISRPKGRGIKPGEIQKKEDAGWTDISKGVDVSALIAVIAGTDPITGDFAGITKEVAKGLTCLIPINYVLDEKGELIPVGYEEVINRYHKFHEYEVHMMLNLTCNDLSILIDKDVQWVLIKNILKAVRERGLCGLQIDFLPSPHQLPAVVGFLRNIMKVLQPLKIPVSVMVNPKVWYGTHSYATACNIVDFITLKTYDLGRQGSESPCAIAPLDLAEEIIRNTVSIIPSTKIMMGISMHGRDWKMDSDSGVFISQKISSNHAILIAARLGAEIKRDGRTGSPGFSYTDEQNQKHTVWFEDIMSIYNKMLLTQKYKLKGVNINSTLFHQAVCLSYPCNT